MLESLPNEMLVKIFKKTSEGTARVCRFLCFRINNLIEREEVHKRKLKRISIGIDQSGQPRAEIDYGCSNEEMPILALEDQNWSWLSSKCQNSLELRVLLYRINITEDFVNKVLGLKCLRYVSILNVSEYSCTELGYEAFLEYIRKQKHLNTLCLRPKETETKVIPVEILNHVSTIFECSFIKHSYYMDLAHFTDELLEEWFCPPKQIRLGNIISGFTLSGIKTHLKKLPENKFFSQRPTYDFGILRNTDPDEIKEMLNSFGTIEWKQWPSNNGVTVIKIETFNGQLCDIFIRAFTNPRN